MSEQRYIADDVSHGDHVADTPECWDKCGDPAAQDADTVALVRAYEEAVKSLAAEAVMIVEAQPDVYVDGLMGPHGAVSLAMSALWQDPSLVHALADYFGVLERTRQEYEPVEERPCAHLHGDDIECSWCGSLGTTENAHIDGDVIA